MSDLICCTQLPGPPEILKMSLATCDPRGGDELWMIGKNFMKDAIVTFQDQDRTWVRTVPPIKEFFNATHLIVMIPPFYEQRLTQPYKVKFLSPLSQPSGCHWGVPLRGATEGCHWGVPLFMELLAQKSNMFEKTPYMWSKIYFWFCQKHNSLLLGPIQPTSPSTKELHMEPPANCQLK